MILNGINQHKLWGINSTERGGEVTANLLCD